MKHTGHEPSMTAHVNLLRALYPWVADLVAAEPFDDWATETVTDYRIFRKGLHSQEVALGRLVAKGLKSREGLLGEASRRRFLESAKALAVLHSHRYRRPKKEVPPNSEPPHPVG